MEQSKLRSDKEQFHRGVKSYQDLWGRKKDKVKYTDERRSARVKSTAVNGVESFYDFITVAYLAGWGEHFHFTPFAPNESITEAMAFFAHKLAYTMELKPGMKVLDVGCGVGGPAREIARFVGCEIVGININQGHIDRAVEMTTQAGLSHLVTYVKGDFMDMPFAESSFDAVYAIEATAHAPSLPQVYTNIRHVLKPGGIFLTSEWVTTPIFDPLNEDHVRARNFIERGNAVPSLPSVDHARESLLSVGFDLFFEENYAHHWKTFLRFDSRPNSLSLLADKPDGDQLVNIDSQTNATTATTATVDSASKSHPAKKGKRKMKPSSLPREWYYALLGQTSQATNPSDWWLTFKMSPVPRKTSYWLIKILEKCRIYSPGVTDAMDIVREAVDGLAEGGRMDVFSPCWWFVCRKTN